MRRSDQRRQAVFALYGAEVRNLPVSDALERDAAPFTRALVYAVDDLREELDAAISRHAKGWTIDRIAPLERSILRVALLELLHPGIVEGDKPIPPEGAIVEAVETAKKYCGADAPGFVNGLLGAAKREHEGSPA